MPQQLANFPTPEEYADMYQNWKRDNFSDKNVPSTASNRSKQSTSDYLSLIITLLTLTVLTAMLFVFSVYVKDERAKQEALNRLMITYQDSMKSEKSASMSSTSTKSVSTNSTSSFTSTTSSVAR
ncbi:hypothetical protein IPJ91_01580 [bacterium]|nr:MAG: hypothetical protein IPJ91_01580 [bacterium]